VHDWSAARSYSGDPAELFAARDELLELLNRPHWHADALCLEHPDVNFFPDRGEDLTAAQSVCGRCSVADACLAYALADPTNCGGAGRDVEPGTAPAAARPGGLRTCGIRVTGIERSFERLADGGFVIVTGGTSVTTPPLVDGRSLSREDGADLRADGGLDADLHRI
jgi:hypothetical protein